MPRRLHYVGIALAAWVLGLCWAVSSPPGSSPDDGFHLTSIYCATGDESLCRDLDGAGPGVEVQTAPGTPVEPCFALQPDTGGGCTLTEADLAPTNSWYNHQGLYPPTFYTAMSVLAGPDVPLSVLLMRLASLTVALGTMALAVWVSPQLRSSQIVAWAVASIPLGMFLFPSTNPSGWGIAGVAAIWPASYALLHSTSRRPLVFAAVACALASLLASSRADTAAFAAFALGVNLVLYARPTKNILAGLVAAFLMVLLTAVFLTSGQNSMLTQGMPGTGTASGSSLLWGNLLGLPELWAGAFGAGGGLGWLDTVMPGSVWLPAIAVASVLVVLGIAKVGIRKGVLLTAFGAVLILYPLVILQLSGTAVGAQFQPRYLLPVVFLFMGVALAPLDGHEIRLTRPQRWVLTVGAVVASSVALHVELRRYATGVDVLSPFLDAGSEWSYFPMAGPMAVWVIGSLAAAALFALVLHLLTPDSTQSDDPAAGRGGAAIGIEPSQVPQPD